MVSVGGGVFDAGSGRLERAVMRSIDDDDEDDDDDTRRRAVGCVRSKIVRSAARGRVKRQASRARRAGGGAGGTDASDALETLGGAVKGTFAIAG